VPVLGRSIKTWFLTNERIPLDWESRHEQAEGEREVQYRNQLKSRVFRERVRRFFLDRRY
jgi:hypothetical protein